MMNNKQQKVRRLFIDPASKSTGWALFEDKQLVEHGTVTADPELQVFARLWDIFTAYYDLALDVEEVHIEQLVRNTHIFTHWSVSAIGIAYAARGAKVAGDIPIQSWQKYCDWHGSQKRLRAYKNKVESEDELSAIGMGLWFLENRVP